MTTTSIIVKGLPIKTQTTATGTSLVCPFKNCVWVEQIAIETPVHGAVVIAEKHYLEAGHINPQIPWSPLPSL